MCVEPQNDKNWLYYYYLQNYIWFWLTWYAFLNLACIWDEETHRHTWYIYGFPHIYLSFNLTWNLYSDHKKMLHSDLGIHISLSVELIFYLNFLKSYYVNALTLFNSKKINIRYAIFMLKFINKCKKVKILWFWIYISKY